MAVEHPDADAEHLLPAFRTRLEAVLVEAGAALGCVWEIVEGYRSQARQDWLFAQGRTRPGPRVTWSAKTRYHGAGVAADVAPVRHGQPWFDAPREWWEKLREIYLRHGLTNPAWERGDLGHIQATDLAAEGRRFVAAGFKARPTVIRIQVEVNGAALPTPGLLLDGAAWVPLRALYAALPDAWRAGWRIGQIEAGAEGESLVELIGVAISRRLPLLIRGRVGYVRGGDLPKLRLGVQWDGAAKTLRVTG